MTTRKPAKKIASAKPPIHTKRPAKDVKLDTVFDELQQLLSALVPPFTATGGGVRDKRDYHLTAPAPVVIPGAYGGKPTSIAVASLILQKGYVGFYYMPVYMETGLKQKLSPALMQLLKGKSCFYVKTLTPELRAGIQSALILGTKCFRERGWL
jgi:hypothetical protein